MVADSQVSWPADEPRWLRVGVATVRWGLMPSYIAFGAVTAVIVARPPLVHSGEPAANTVLFPLTFILAALASGVLLPLLPPNPWLRVLRFCAAGGLFALVVIAPLQEHHMVHSVSAWAVFGSIFLVVATALIWVPEAFTRLAMASPANSAASTTA